MEKNISQASMHKQILSTHDHDQGVKYHTVMYILNIVGQNEIQVKMASTYVHSQFSLFPNPNIIHRSGIINYLNKETKKIGNQQRLNHFTLNSILNYSTYTYLKGYHVWYTIFQFFSHFQKYRNKSLIAMFF